MWRDRIQDEGGVALIYVLFATMVISGLVVIFMSRVLFENRSTAEARDFEAAIHVGEAGAEALFGEISTEDKTAKIVTTKSDGTTPHVHDSGWTQAQEEAWAVDLAKEHWLAHTDTPAVYPTMVVRTDEGLAFGIRPEDAATGEAADIVFGVGFVPSIDHPDRTVRVVKMRINRNFFSPDHALLTGADLKLGGNAEILAPGCTPSTEENCNADVHANGNVDVVGSSHEVQGNFTASGSMSGTPVTTGGSSSDGEPIVKVPEITARDFYNRDTTYNADPGGQEVRWFDLCPDETVREPSTTTPCTGTQIWPAPSDTSSSFRGWTFKNGSWESRKVEAGIFYVYHADAQVNGSAIGDNGQTQRAVTILVETDPADPGGSGSLEMSGNPELVSALPDVLFILDRDLKLKGTAGGGKEDCDPDPDPCDTQSYAGFIYAGEQVDVSGTVELSGAMIAQDVEDLHGLVKRNTAGINGTMVLDYDDNLELDLSGRVTIEYWNEL